MDTPSSRGPRRSSKASKLRSRIWRSRMPTKTHCDCSSRIDALDRELMQDDRFRMRREYAQRAALDANAKKDAATADDRERATKIAALDDKGLTAVFRHATLADMRLYLRGQSDERVIEAAKRNIHFENALRANRVDDAAARGELADCRVCVLSYT